MLAENPMIERENKPLYIFHTQQPPMLIQVHHESYSVGDTQMYLTGNYQGPEGLIETITLSVAALLICEPEVSEELKAKVDKVLSKAWHWYTAYLNWEDSRQPDEEEDLE